MGNQDNYSDFTSSSGTKYGSRGGKFGSEYYTTVLEYLSVLTDANFSLLNTIKSSFSEILIMSKNNLNAINYTEWNDSVSNKLSLFTEDLKKTKIDQIKSDVETGNFNNLINELTKLKTECEKYKAEENKVINLSFRKQDDSKEYYESYDVNKLSLTGKEDVRNYNSKIAQQTKNLQTLETNIKAIVATIGGISFLSEINHSSIQVETINDASTYSENFEIWRDNYLMTDTFVFFDDYGNQIEGRMIFDPKTGNRIIEYDGQIVIYKTRADGSQMEWYAQSNFSLDSDQTFKLLSTPFEDSDVSHGPLGTYGESSYGPKDINLMPGRTNLFINTPEFSLPDGENTYNFKCFYGDPTIGFLQSQGIDAKYSE